MRGRKHDTHETSIEWTIKRNRNDGGFVFEDARADAPEVTAEIDDERHTQSEKDSLDASAHNV